MRSHGAADAHTLVVPGVTVVCAETDQQGNHHAHVCMHIRLRRPEGAVSFGVELVQKESNNADQAEAQCLEQHARKHAAVDPAENAKHGTVVVPMGSCARTYVLVTAVRGSAHAAQISSKLTPCLLASLAPRSPEAFCVHDPAPVFNDARASAH